MNVAATFAPEPRCAASPYARRLARERSIALADLTGSGPQGRITAVDVLAYQAPAASPPAEQASAAPAIPVITFAAEVSLVALYQLARDAERVGLAIEAVDIALRAARTAFKAIESVGVPLIALEAEGQQILINQAGGLSIGAERRLRLDALDAGTDVAKDPATASLLVLQAARVSPVSLPLLPNRDLRLALVVDEDAERAYALLCANSAAVSEAKALELLEAFVVSLEQPLALMA